MSDPRLPYYRWFPSDFAGMSRGWPLEAQAVYRNLCDAQWDMGALPDDDSALQRIANASKSHWKKAWPYVEPYFPLDNDGRRRNEWLETTRAEAQRQYEKRREKARKGADARWGSDRVVAFRARDKNG